MTIVLAFLSLFYAHAATPATKPTLIPTLTVTKGKLHVMSYNIKGLPNMVISSDYKIGRFSIIGKLLRTRISEGTGPEVVALQEAFTSDTAALIEASSFPHKAVGPGTDSLLGVGSGLYILSRYPIVEEASAVFGPKSCVSWDCMANKGVQLARISVPNLPIPLEIYNTHLQAGREDTSTRQAQVKILLEFFRKHHKEGSPVIFAGDFNFRPGLNQQSYLDFTKGIKLSHAGKYCLDNKCSRSPDTGWHGIWERAVDHQFYRAGKGMKMVPLFVERTYREPVEDHKLSDHPAHEVQYELDWGA